MVFRRGGREGGREGGKGVVFRRRGEREGSGV